MNKDTVGGLGTLAFFIGGALGFYSQDLAAQSLLSEQAAVSVVTDWHQVGNSLIAQGLAGPASGPVMRVWFAGGSLLARSATGITYRTRDAETWFRVADGPPAQPASAPAHTLPEPNAEVRATYQDPTSLFAFGNFVYRSRDNGAHWENVTGFHGKSIIGSTIFDLVLHPDDPDQVVAATSSGVFRSMDGGRSWDSLNPGMPSLDARRLLSLPSGAQGTRIATSNNAVIYWDPGQKLAWLPGSDPAFESELDLKAALSTQFEVLVTAVARSGSYWYFGTDAGAVWVSTDQGLTWRNTILPAGGKMERIWIDPQDARIALAVLSGDTGGRVVHSVNGGGFWEDLTNNLPGNIFSITADRTSGALYVATGDGVYFAYSSRGTLSNPSRWSKLRGLPDAKAVDVRLDDQGHQLWAAVDGFGVFVTLAPHRLRDPRVVTAADFVARAVAPGSLLSVLGVQLESVAMNGVAAPLLASTADGTQIQVPFEARGSSINLTASRGGADLNLPSLPLSTAAPAIFVSSDGSPMLLDADKGVMLDAMNPARSGSRIHVLASGLGRVKPEWPSGVPAPTNQPPSVAGAVRAFLDRIPVEVTRATLAPGYVGLYLVEIAVPRIVNFGPAELYIDVEGVPSNPVRVYIEP